MSLMCLDLAGAKTGVIIVEGGGVVDAQVIVTEKSKIKSVSIANDDFDRSVEVVSILCDLIDTWGVKAIIAELPAGSQSARAAKMFGMSLGLIAGVTYCNDLPTEFHTPMNVKKGFHGNKNASKDDMIDLAIEELKLKVRYKKGSKEKKRQEIEIAGEWFARGGFEHIADSIGVWYTAKKSKSNLVIIYG